MLSRINRGELVATTVVHLSEVANIVEARAGKSKAIEVVEKLLSKENIVVYSVEPGDYIASTSIAKEYGVGVNDALALLFMRKLGINEIHSFDRGLDKVPWVKRVRVVS